jgi:hypothetical protein
MDTGMPDLLRGTPDPSKRAIGRAESVFPSPLSLSAKVDREKIGMHSK